MFSRITFDKPIKIWQGNSKLARKYSSYDPMLSWAITIKKGDWVGACDGCNRQVADIQYEWSNVGSYFIKPRQTNTWVLTDVIFVDTHGRKHYTIPGHCVFPKQSCQEIENYFRSWIECVEEDPACLNWDNGKFGKRLSAINEAFKTGGTIVDKNGQLLPLFDV